jgi:hypothetical protein
MRKNKNQSFVKKMLWWQKNKRFYLSKKNPTKNKLSAKNINKRRTKNKLAAQSRKVNRNGK